MYARGPLGRISPRVSLPKTQSGVGNRGGRVSKRTSALMPGEVRGHTHLVLTPVAGSLERRPVGAKWGSWACCSGGASVLVMKTADVRESHHLSALG